MKHFISREDSCASTSKWVFLRGPEGGQEVLKEDPYPHLMQALQDLWIEFTQEKDHLIPYAKANKKGVMQMEKMRLKGATVEYILFPQNASLEQADNQFRRSRYHNPTDTADEKYAAFVQFIEEGAPGMPPQNLEDLLTAKVQLLETDGGGGTLIQFDFYDGATGEVLSLRLRIPPVRYISATSTWKIKNQKDITIVIPGEEDRPMTDEEKKFVNAFFQDREEKATALKAHQPQRGQAETATEYHPSRAFVQPREKDLRDIEIKDKGGELSGLDKELKEAGVKPKESKEEEVKKETPPPTALWSDAEVLSAELEQWQKEKEMAMEQFTPGYFLGRYAKDKGAVAEIYNDAKVAKISQLQTNLQAQIAFFNEHQATWKETHPKDRQDLINTFEAIKNRANSVLEPAGRTVNDALNIK